jgi:hypothetical protein
VACACIVQVALTGSKAAARQCFGNIVLLQLMTMEQPIDSADLDALETLVALGLIRVSDVSDCGEPSYVFEPRTFATRPDTGTAS